MRHIKDIPHERFKIQLMNYNAKYILKIEIDQFEQLYKIGELDVTSLDVIEKMITPVFLKNCLKIPSSPLPSASASPTSGQRSSSST